MTKALISIDYSYDFVADDGKLTAGKPAQAIEDRIAQVTQEAYDNGAVSYTHLTLPTTMGIISLLPWIDMMKEIPSILKPSSFHRTILQGRLGENFMVS